MVRRVRTALAALLALLLSAAGAAAQPGCADAPGLAALVAEMHAAINRERTREALGTLAYNRTIERAARNHGCDMVVHGYFSHTGRDGSTPRIRLERVGFNPCFAAETLALGQTSVGRTVQAWMAWQGHRANILDRRARGLGLAVTRREGGGPLHWTLVLARAC